MRGLEFPVKVVSESRMKNLSTIGSNSCNRTRRRSISVEKMVYRLSSIVSGVVPYATE